ncbi:peptidoglycan-binding domain-containing protein [Streptomyces sp. GC420]|uniref:peptidoglycan-binding domain-containing protein n=1 Tax=Streptomyces sp. GC420 TaxID=2697568 RepID=UPI0028BDABF4|nr:peptidoglycan-binding domain-containing protein [Streptomyces sp. GC420]
MSTPSDPGEPPGRPALEPSLVLRPRRPRPLSDFAELFRPEGQVPRPPRPRGQGEDGIEGPEEDWDFDRLAVPSPTELPAGLPAGAGAPANPAAGPGAGTGAGHDPAAEETQPFAPFPADPGNGPGAVSLHRKGPARLTAVVVASALAGLGVSLLIPDGGSGRSAAPGGDSPPRSSAPPSAPSPGGTAPAPADPGPGADGSGGPDDPGVLRQGDSGPAVTELQRRLRRIPDVYRDGAVDGRYDATLAAAVSRFQTWYGIRGDESGVYGDDTRRDLESRTRS